MQETETLTCNLLQRMVASMRLIPPFEQIVVRHFSLFLMVAVGIGILFPSFSAGCSPLVLSFLMAVIYLGFLKTDYRILGKEMRNIKRQLWLNLFCLILIPSLLFVVAKGLEGAFGTHPAWSTGVLLLFGCPVAALAPTLSMVMHGHFERTLCCLILTSFIAPFTLPLLLSFWVGATIEVDLLSMMLFLIRLVLFPFIGAQVTLHLVKPLHKALLPHTAALSVLLLIVVIVGAVDGLAETVRGNPGLILEGVAVASCCLFLSYGIGWLLPGRKASFADKSTLSILATWSNIGLAIVFAKQFFPDSDILLFVVLAEIPWNSAFAPAHAFIRAKHLQLIPA